MGVAKATPWRRSCTAKGLRIMGRSHSEPTISHLTASPIVSPWNTRMARRTACLRYVRICSFLGRYPCCVRVACRDDELASSLSRQEMAYPLRLGMPRMSPDSRRLGQRSRQCTYLRFSKRSMSQLPGRACVSLRMKGGVLRLFVFARADSTYSSFGVIWNGQYACGLSILQPEPR